MRPSFISLRRSGVLLATLVAAAAAQASLVSVSSSVTVLGAAPANVRVGQLTSLTNSFLFQEKMGATLASPLTVNAAAPGTYNTPAPVVSSLTAGTVFDSFYFHVDAGANVRSYTSVLAFDSDIIGLIFGSQELVDSNFLGVPTTLYSTSSVGNQRFELSATEFITVSADRRTLTVTNQVNGGLDDMRILTDVAVPEPGSLALASLALAGVGFSRRSRTRR